MKTYIKKRFLAWDENGETAIALVEPDGNWFMVAINCCRDGDMGYKGEDGVWSRGWWGDGIRNGEAENIRPATISETRLYLSHYSPEESLEYEGQSVVAIILGEESYVIFEQ